MSNKPQPRQASSPGARALVLATALLAALLAVAPAQAAPYQLTALTVVGPNGEAITGYRWLIQEDTTKDSAPGAAAVPGQTLAVSFHTSYAPALDAGCISCAANPGAPAPVDRLATAVTLDSSKKYYISVLPNSGYSNGGVQVAPGQTTVTVLCQKLPLPTGQLSVFVFEDNTPINNEPDLPEEQGLAGFQPHPDRRRRHLRDVGRPDLPGRVRQPARHDVQPVPRRQPRLHTDRRDARHRRRQDRRQRVRAVPEPLPRQVHDPGGPARRAGLAPDGDDRGHEGRSTRGSSRTSPRSSRSSALPATTCSSASSTTMNDATVLTGGSTITGRIVNLHNSRPPIFDFYAGDPVPGAWVGLNTGAAGAGRGVFAQACNPTTGEFSIPNVPAGTYQLAVWDENLDLIFDLENVTVPPGGGAVALHDVPVFNWFAKLEAKSSTTPTRTASGTSARSACRTRRSTCGSATAASTRASSPTRRRRELPRGVPVLQLADHRGRLRPLQGDRRHDRRRRRRARRPDQGWAFPSRGKLNPLPQLAPGRHRRRRLRDARRPARQPEHRQQPLAHRDGAGPARGYPGLHLGQTNVIECGKKAYSVGENGGIAGIVAVRDHARRERPAVRGRRAVGARDPARRGRPLQGRRQQRHRTRTDKQVDDLNGDGRSTRPDVDNYPFGWADGGAMGPEDVKRNGDVAGCNASRACAFDLGDALEMAWSDSWDDLCRPAARRRGLDPGQPIDCFDGLRHFNQVRPAVFDGGYRVRLPGGPELACPGTYIVEAVAPPGYGTSRTRTRTSTSATRTRRRRRCSCRPSASACRTSCRSTSRSSPAGRQPALTIPRSRQDDSRLLD